MHVTVRNGLTLAYVVAVINAVLALLLAFGLNLSSEQQGAIALFINASVMLAARVLHLPERTPDGGTIKVSHLPVITEKPPKLIVQEPPKVVVLEPVVEPDGG